jgi:hypothetical protein
MRVTILPADNVIFIDGKGKALNCMTLRSKQISFVRWHGSRGEIRYADGGERTFRKTDKFMVAVGFSLQSLIDQAKPFK